MRFGRMVVSVAGPVSDRNKPMSAMGKKASRKRRDFCGLAAGSVLGARLIREAVSSPPAEEASATGVRVSESREGEDLFAHIERVRGRFDQTFYRQIIGAANPFKEGDRILGVAAADDDSRQQARSLLANTRVGRLAAQPLFDDALYARLQ